MPAFPSPDIRNISVGAGYIEFMPEGDSVFHHVGNVPNFQFAIKTDTLDYYVPADGVRVKAYSYTTEQQAEIEIEMEEITAQNLALLMLGDVTSAGGVTHVSIQARNGKVGALRYTATNEQGPRWHIDLRSVMFSDGGEFVPLGGGDFNTIKIKADVLFVNGTYGEMTLI
jgi:hypothetical protein